MSLQQQNARVRTVMENLEKLWNLILPFSRPGKLMEKGPAWKTFGILSAFMEKFWNFISLQHGKVLEFYQPSAGTMV